MIDFDRDTAFAEKVLDAMAVRAKVAMHNVANQNVPGFKRYQVRFEDLLREAGEDAEALEGVQPEVTRDESGGQGQNNVSLMDEMAALDKVRLLHDVFTRRLGGHFSQLNRAIFGR
jgi:flagellar basal-body rod protein FlgB